MTELTWEESDNRLTVRLSGELDHHAAGRIREEIDNAVLRRKCRCLRLDLSALGFMDSSGIGLIMGRYRLMSSINGRLELFGVDSRLERMIRLAGLDKLPIWEKNETERTTPHETDQ